MAKYDKADLERRMHGAVEALKSDLAGLRTGRAHTALLDPVTVEVYGSHMPLNQVASVSAPEPRMLSVQVWDKSNVGPVDAPYADQRARGQRVASVPVHSLRRPGVIALHHSKASR